MKFTFLHLSDLHYRTGWDEEVELVCNKFLEDVSVQTKNFPKAYLAFSGDLVFAGSDAALYDAFQDKFGKAFDQVGYPRERRICIPGNHDISRTALQPLIAMHQGTLAEMKTERAFNDTLPQFAKTILMTKFDNYLPNEARFAKQTCCESSLGGTGWELENNVGVYCLNTALCSAGGLNDLNGMPISDKGRLLIDTRSLHRWLAETPSSTRILIMHHPVDWLAEWAQLELERIIAEKFHLVLSGHIHQASATYSTRGDCGSVHCVAPPLFTRKSDLLGYAFVTIDTSTHEVEVLYRNWTPAQKFVMGASLAGKDSGKIVFPPIGTTFAAPEVVSPQPIANDTSTILQLEFDEAITCYSSKRRFWVDRDLSHVSETAGDRATALMVSPTELIQHFRSCIIRAPKEFGLTCLGHYVALEYHRQSKTGLTIAMIDTIQVPGHRRGVVEYIRKRCAELFVAPQNLAGIILDNWQNVKQARRVLEEIQKEFPSVPVMLLHGLDDCMEIADGIQWEGVAKFETFYLWALSRPRVRELVVAYIEDLSSLDDDLVTKKLLEDIDALNIHRTPLNCLTILKLLEQSFDDSPVNRTEMIGRVLYLLFCEFDEIPRYATRPDLKDCEYALGYVCEWLIRLNKAGFTKTEFYEKVREYCTDRILDLDCEVLFAFLVTENIFIRKGHLFEFRFTYWLYYFAAHRMHHDPDFSEYILGGKYSATPEIIEFYTGIDRRRTDAIIRLTADLKRMNSEFLTRTGIDESFNPFEHARWEPDAKSLQDMQRNVAESVADSSLPKVVKDAIADQSYDRAKPYHQELAKFINESTLIQMVQTMKGAARALRNSDHVPPELKTELLEEVMRCWTRVCQVIVLISPLLAERKTAAFEGMGFILQQGFDELNPKRRWEQIMSVVTDNVVKWFQEDVFSKKMGALFSRYIDNKHGSLIELLVILVLAKQRPPGWEREVEQFIVRTHKNSYYLSRMYAILGEEFRTSFSSEGTRQQLRRLTAMAVAKHATGAKHPNIQLVEKAAKTLDRDQTNENN